MSLENVFITGANRGLGASLVDACLLGGATSIYAGCRNPDELPVRQAVQPLYLELRDDASIERAAAQADKTNVLINNAGIIGYEGVMNAPDLDHAKQIMETNLWGTLAMCRAFRPTLERNNGCIVNILSIGALVAYPVAGPYCASKAALFSVTQSMRAELKDSGVRVVSVFVGPMQTDMVTQHSGSRVRADEVNTVDGRTSPALVAEQIVLGLQAGEVNIFADETAKGLAELYDHKLAELETGSRP